MTSGRLATAVLIVWAAVSGGCAKLQIGVDVYKGPLTLPPEKRLDVAVGRARELYRASDALNKRFERVLNELRNRQASRSSSKDKETIEELEALSASLSTVVNVFNGAPAGTKDREPSPAGVDALWQDYANHRDETGRGDPKTRTRLVHTLAMFGTVCISAGERLALPTIVKTSGWKSLIGNVAIYGINGRREDSLSNGVAMEEVGREVLLLVEDSAQADDRATISAMMQSTTPGVVSESLRQLAEPPTLLGKAAAASGVLPVAGSEVFKAWERLNWSQINDVKLGGFGETNLVVVKDEIGNWHVKTVELRQEDVTKALFDGVTLMAKVAASAYGVPVNIGGGKARPQPLGAGDVSAAEGLEQQAQVAGELERQIRAAKRTLDRDLDAAARMPDNQNDAALNHISRAVTLYNSRIQGLQLAAPAAASPPAADQPATPSDTDTPSPP